MVSTCTGRPATWRFRDLSQPVIAPAGVQALQVLTVLFGAPLVSGATSKVEALMQGRRGPRVLQPYYDLAKLFRKETVVPEGASWVFLAGPVVAFSSYLTVPLLIPVLTSYGLPLGYMGDILGGGMLLALAASPLHWQRATRARPTRSSAPAGPWPFRRWPSPRSFSSSSSSRCSPAPTCLSLWPQLCAPPRRPSPRATSQ